MEQKPYYVETCIWLNLCKKEGDATKGIPYWILTEDFLEQADEDDATIFVSTITLKELFFKLGDKFEELKQFFNENEYIQLIKTTPEDYDLAREFEKNHALLSFYDYLHVAICKRLGCPLVTRDRDLIEFAREHIDVSKPEDLY